MMIEILTDWDCAGSAGGVTVMYFDEASTTPGAARTNIGAMWTGMAQALATTTGWTVRTNGRLIDEATGALTGFWNEDTLVTGDGTASGIPVTNASQALVQWLTDDIVNGRRVRGRTFVPGVSGSNSSNGEVQSAGEISGPAADFITENWSGPAFGIWHRPSPGSPGSHHLVTAADVWQEFAVLRKRRS